MTMATLGIFNDMPKGWLSFHPVNRSIYAKWRSMWNRTTEEFIQTRPTYRGVAVCEDWRYLSNFVAWIESQATYLDFKTSIKGYCIDKDTILPGNKLYCPEYCLLITVSENSKESVNRNGTILSYYKGENSPSKKLDNIRAKRRGVIAVSDNKVLLLKAIGLAYEVYGFYATHIRRSIKDKNKYKNYRWYYLKSGSKKYKIRGDYYVWNNK
jgi:hypothetical protein